MSTPSYDPRTIALLAEIIYPPLELQVAAVQKIHNELFSHKEFAYQNFAVTAEGIQLSNPVEQAGAVSLINFLPDRLQVREELTGAHIDDFCRRLEHALEIAIRHLNLPILVAQQHVVRSLINARSFKDSREFLAGAVCGLSSDKFVSFERPVSLFGMKMIFPVVEAQSDYHTLRIESFNQDPRSVFVEDVATFTSAVMPDDLEKVSANMRSTYRFLLDRALPFLAAHDRERQTE